MSKIITFIPLQMPRMQEFIVIDPHPVLIICSHTCVNVSLLWFQLLSQFIDATKSMFSYKGISSLSYSFITLGWRGRPQFLVNICCRLYLIARKMALQAMTQAHMDNEHVLESKWRTNFLRLENNSMLSTESWNKWIHIG